MDNSTFNKEIQRLKEFDEAYFNDEPIIPDLQYDDLKNKLYAINPDHSYFSQVGSPVRGGKIDLPYPMGSLNQIYDGDYEKWVKRHGLHNHEIISTPKLDGMSALLVYQRNKSDDQLIPLSIAYSRGDGLRGADITRHLSKIPALPRKVKSSMKLDSFAVRAEIIMPETTFQTKFKNEGKNSRNFVSGCMNRKETEQRVLDDIHVVAYELVDFNGNLVGEFEDVVGEFTKKNALDFLNRLGFFTVNYETHQAKDLNDDKLAEQFSNMRDDCKYLIDGIVLTVNEYSSMERVTKSDTLNPEHSVKFKTLGEDALVDTEVVDVHWKVSKSGYLKPRVQIEPVELFGTTVTYATGFNGKYIYDNKIGKGAKIKITKSGAVIPYIVEITHPTTPAMPELEWEWDSMGVEARAKNSADEVSIMQAVHFFKTLDVEQLKEASLRKMISKYCEGESFSGIIITLLDLLDTEWKRVLGENGLKIYGSLHKKLQNLEPSALLGASPFFGQGFGVRKAKKIMAEMNFEEFKTATADEIESIEGFDKTSATICGGIPNFQDFFNEISPYVKFADSDPEQSGTELSGKVIVFTGFRDKQLQKDVEDKGGRVASAVSGKTTTVVAADPSENSSKIKKGKDAGLEILSKEEFINLYM